MPHSVLLILGGIWEGTAMVRHFVRTVRMASDGIQSHCGTHASNTRSDPKYDVIREEFLVERRIYADLLCAKNI